MKNTMILNTLLPWIIAIVFLLSVTGLLFLSGGKSIALIVVPIAFSVFVFPIAGAISGVLAANGNASFLSSTAITLVLVIVLFYLATHGLHTIDTDAFIVFTPLLVFLTAYGLTLLVNYCKTSHPILYIGSNGLVFLVAFIFLYLLGAYQSKMAYFSLPKELFYTQVANDITNVHVLSDEKKFAHQTTSVLVADDGKPFTGVITSYEERLNLNFFTKKESGIAYYIDGLNFGESGKIIPPGHYNSWHGSYTGTDFWFAGDRINQNTKTTILLHKDYQHIIETEFPQNKAIFYQETPSKDTSTFDPYPLPKVTVVFADEGHIVRYHIQFYPNGVIKYIERYFFGLRNMEEKVPSWYDRDMFSFDKLGFRSTYETEQKWDKSDFIETQFNSYERIKNSVRKDLAVIKNPDKMIYVPEPENWVNKDLMDNLVAVFGMPLTVIYTYIDDKNGYWQGLDVAEAQDFCELMTRSTITINYLDADDSIRDFQRKATKFRITSKDDADKKLFLYYLDGKILVQDGPYYLDVAAEKENEPKDDIAFRKKLYKNVKAIIEKYVKKENQ